MMTTKGTTILLCLMVVSLHEISCHKEIIDMYYYVKEEVPANTFIGNVLQMSNLSSIHTPDVIERLYFTFFKQLRRQRDTNAHEIGEYKSYSLDSKTGDLRVFKRLDREAECPGKEECTDKFDIAVRPVEYFIILRVTIIIVDINDNPPIFPMENVIIPVSENTQVGTSINIPVAIDNDSPEFSIQRYFIHEYSLIYKPTNEKNFYFFSNISKVSNFSSIYPYFAKDQLNNDNHHNQYHQHHRDYYNSLHNAHGDFSDISGAKMPFEIAQGQSRSGSIEAFLRLKYSLDREKISSYYLVVEAVDKNDAEKSKKSIERSILRIKIEIEDVNDNSPVFGMNIYEVDVEETIPIGSIITTVKATDLDEGANKEITYEFSSLTYNAFGDVFAIDKVTGEILNKQSLDFETISFYRLTVVAQDQGAGSTPITATVQINVIDVNDNAPKISVETLSSQFGLTKVQENSPPDTFVAHVSVSDLDGGPNGHVSCHLQNAENVFGLKMILESEYQIVTTRILDREQQARYLLELECRDNPMDNNEVMLGKAQIEVEVTDMNDNAPVLSNSDYTFEFYENNYVGAIVGTFSATDRDTGENAELIFSLKNTHHKSSKFSSSSNVPIESMLKIEPRTGVLISLVSFDREIVGRIEFLVVVEDMGSPVRSSTSKATIIINDVNDCAPVFSQESYVFEIAENRPLGETVGMVQAQDEDIGSNGEVFYEIIPTYNDHDMWKDNINYFDNDKHAKYNDHISKLFSIDSTSGLIISSVVFDRELKSSYHFQVRAVDKSFDNPLSSSCSITVMVTDENDNYPVINHPSIYNRTIEIPTSSPVGYLVFRVLATDADTFQDSKLYYSLNQQDHLFEIDRELGSIYVATSLSSQENSCHQLIITVSDDGFPPLSTSTSLIVCLNNSESFLNQIGKYLWRDGYMHTNSPYRNLTIVVVLAIVSTFITIALFVAILILNKQDNENKNRPVKDHYLVTTTKNGTTTSSELKKTYNCDFMTLNNHTLKATRPWLDSESNFQKNVFKNEFSLSSPDKKIDSTMSTYQESTPFFADISTNNVSYIHSTTSPNHQPKDNLYPSLITPLSSSKEVDKYLSTLSK